MPSKNDVRLHDEQSIFPALPGSRENRPEEAIRPAEFYTLLPPLQDGELLAECKVFQGKIGT